MTDLPLLISTLEEDDHGLVELRVETRASSREDRQQLRAGKERPILFSAPMVRALLAGTKTQTRRVVKVPEGLRAPLVQNDDTGEWGWWWTEWRWEGHGLDARHIPYDEHFHAIRCPYGLPGDTLWVREAFSGPWLMDCVPPREWLHDEPIWYWADGNPTDGDWTRPKPSIHMPRAMSRIALRITDVRVERLQDISETDALAEGIQRYPDGFHWEPNTGWPGEPAGSESMRFVGRTAAQAFHGLWEMINGRESLDANPWLWCVSFERVPA